MSEIDLFRAQANTILRRLKNLGWLEVETRDNFKQYIANLRCAKIQFGFDPIYNSGI
ncbi:Wadjet anti-phage system protein JetA family protein [Desulfosporosinus sp. HMP52]|uniref:Wadjet anti-phage system protein JetA family protein n=1 Tax=Desulfosporosinus sp. HMP52 TaxID=1487923 RepID=UPI0013F48A05|nr:Wadjet anti-phage system protein JetA family protein [Desulfosporosinus sp. HMP52]